MSRYEYGPFGEVFCSVGDMARVNPFQFSTKYTDSETDLVYYGYRYYSPALGRWLSRDPIEEQGGLNLYGFVNNDPVNYVDSQGQSIVIIPTPIMDIPERVLSDGPRTIDSPADAFEAWHSRQGWTNIASSGVINKIKNNSYYKTFLKNESIKKVYDFAICGKRGKYAVNARSDVFETRSLVIGRIFVKASGRCSWRCDKSSPSFLHGCACECDVSCLVNVDFLDKYDFYINEGDSFLRKKFTEFTGKINNVFAGDGTPFFITGKWKERLSFTFFIQDNGGYNEF